MCVFTIYNVAMSTPTDVEVLGVWGLAFMNAHYMSMFAIYSVAMSLLQRMLGSLWGLAFLNSHYMSVFSIYSVAMSLLQRMLRSWGFGDLHVMMFASCLPF